MGRVKLETPEIVAVSLPSRRAVSLMPPDKLKELFYTFYIQTII